MKTIGLIGGMSWESSKMYYEFINRRVQALLGGNHSAKSVMVSVDFDTIEKLSFAGDWKEIGRLMALATKQLESAGADVVVLCTNTIHLVADSIRSATELPFIHIADTTADAIRARGLKRVGLLGTAFTMEKEFYKGHISNTYGIDIIVPGQGDREIVHNIIYKELVKGVFKTESRSKVKKIMHKLVDEGAEGIIMGCTELPLIVPGNSTEIITFDTSEIHAFAAVDWVLKNSEALIQ